MKNSGLFEEGITTWRWKRYTAIPQELGLCPNPIKEMISLIILILKRCFFCGETTMFFPLHPNFAFLKKESHKT